MREKITEQETKINKLCEHVYKLQHIILDLNNQKMVLELKLEFAKNQYNDLNKAKQHNV